MPDPYLTYKKPSYLGTDLQSVEVVASVKSRSRSVSKKARIGRVAVGEVIRGSRVRVVRVNNTPFIMSDNDEPLADGIEHYCYAHVVVADATDGTLILHPERISADG